jgi:hypothetical protein
MALTANDYAAELIDAGWIDEDILASAEESRKTKAVDDRLQYHMGAVFLTKKSRNTITAAAPIGALGSYTLTHSPLIRKEIDGKMSKVYVNAEGYTESYENLCAALGRTISASTTNAIDALRGSGITRLMN